MKHLIPVIVLFLSACSYQQTDQEPVTAIDYEPIASGLAACQMDPEFCVERCRACDDPHACFHNGGVCLQANVSYDDLGDNAGDVFTPGCHYKYTGANCPINTRARFDQDVCSNAFPNNIWEWTVSACHAPIGDLSLFDCDKICRQLNLGPGTCVTVPNACGQGWNSAKCKCEKDPVPNPTISN